MIQESVVYNSNMVLDAIQFGIEKHAGQFRRGGDIPYITHPIAVSYIVAQYKQSKHLVELVVAAILHDVLEDTDTTREELEQRFTPLVASLVVELTSNPEEIKRLGKFEYIKEKMMHMSSYALTIKLSDRLHNISDKPTVKMLKDTMETMDYLLGFRQDITNTQVNLIGKIMHNCRAKMAEHTVKPVKPAMS